MPTKELINGKCISQYYITHERSSDGYSSNWYDLESGADDKEYNYFVTVPEKKGDLYFTTETYMPGMVPASCITRTIRTISGGIITTNQPVVFMEVLNAITNKRIEYKYYVEAQHFPVIIKEADYAPG